MLLQTFVKFFKTNIIHKFFILAWITYIYIFCTPCCQFSFLPFPFPKFSFISNWPCFGPTEMPFPVTSSVSFVWINKQLITNIIAITLGQFGFRSAQRVSTWANCIFCHLIYYSLIHVRESEHVCFKVICLYNCPFYHSSKPFITSLYIYIYTYTYRFVNFLIGKHIVYSVTMCFCDTRGNWLAWFLSSYRLFYWFVNYLWGSKNMRKVKCRCSLKAWEGNKTCMHWCRCEWEYSSGREREWRSFLQPTYGYEGLKGISSICWLIHTHTVGVYIKPFSTVIVWMKQEIFCIPLTLCLDWRGAPSFCCLHHWY